jgi:DNA-binding MarR family transcriptional regulator
VSEWRVLSVLAHSGELPFATLVEQVVADKAQVSRTLQLLAGRGLVEIEARGAARRHGTTCRMTDAGRALYAEVMPQAQRSQADMILALTREERRVLFAVLKKLQMKCLQTNADASE